jgi:hypothetical protein
MPVLSPCPPKLTSILSTAAPEQPAGAATVGAVGELPPFPHEAPHPKAGKTNPRPISLAIVIQDSIRHAHDPAPTEFVAFMAG